jgi:ubiquinone/menaquinone biosynthesis C-methylase UbiE
MPRHTIDEPKTPLEIFLEAHRIAFAPIMFQAARLCRDLGVLSAAERAGREGLTADDIARQTNLSIYGVRVLTEAALSLNLLRLTDSERFVLSRVGRVFLNDQMVRVNTDFTQDVCYQGVFHLEEAIREGKPAGLKVFGDWPTIYEGLSQLPEKVQKSWFAFDHYYSDRAFPDALPRVFSRKPRRLLDVGGNTGKFAVACIKHDPDVRVTILDLPGQLEKARKNVEAAGVGERVEGVPTDLLDAERPFPAGFDAVWMSQFLCCFSEEQVISLLQRGASALAPGGALYVLDTYWDRQSNPVAAYCLHASSLYFTAMANGTSRMYHSRDMLRCLDAAGLRVVEETDNLGAAHTLFVCEPKG